jgi:hypothetical protein
MWNSLSETVGQAQFLNGNTNIDSRHSNCYRILAERSIMRKNSLSVTWRENHGRRAERGTSLVTCTNCEFKRYVNWQAYSSVLLLYFVRPSQELMWNIKSLYNIWSKDADEKLHIYQAIYDTIRVFTDTYNFKQEVLERTNLPTFLTLFKNVICIKTSVWPNITLVGIPYWNTPTYKIMFQTKEL